MILVVLVLLIPVVRSAVLPNIIFGSYGVLLLGANPKDGTSESGFKGQIFDFSFDNKDDNNCWSNGYVGEGYQIPDCYCGHYWPRGSTSLHNGALYAHSSEEYQIGLSAEMTFAQSGTIGGIFVDFGKYSFEYSKGFNFTGSFFNSQTGVVITSKCFHESYYVELNERFSPSNRNLLALSEDFLFDVASLPVQYDVRKYVDFLKAWGDHYPDKMTMGGYVVGLSYFSDKNYQATVATGIDITATAEKDAWFRGTTSNSGGGSTDESVKIYQSYADGGQFLAFRSHPPPASGDLNQWDKDVDSYPFPILMGLAPITNLLTSEWFPNNSNINSIQSNMARAINDFCTVESCFVPKPPPPPPQPTVSSEYVLTGKGSNKISLGHQHETSFCFITRGRAWYESGEVCHLTREGDGWFLAFNSGQPDFECGARCVENFSFTGYTQEFINTGSRQGSISEIPVQSGFCFLTYGSTWGGDDGCWTSDQDGGGSWKNSRSVTDDHADSFVCGSTCVYWKTPTTNNYFLTKSGKGNNSDRMQPVSTHFCYISYGAHWYMGGERCMVQPKEDGYWYLVYNSGQDHFGCQAQCISFN